MTKKEERKVVKAINALSKAVQVFNEATGGSDPIIASSFDNPSLFSSCKKHCADVHVKFEDFYRIAELLGETEFTEYDVPVGDGVNHYYQFMHDGLSVFAITLS